MKKALIIGYAGQDGRILTKVLVKEGWSVVGIGKNSVFSNLFEIEKTINILDFKDISNLIKSFKPDQVYFLAAYHQSSEEKVVDELSVFQKSFNINTMSILYFLESIKQYSPRLSKIYNPVISVNYV